MDTKNADAATAPADPTDPTADGTPAGTGEPGRKDADPVVGEKPDEDLLDALDDDGPADEELLPADPDAEAATPYTGAGAGAAAVVAAGLGVSALTGTWVSRVAAERQTLIGQIESQTAASTAEKISALYGDAWHLTALVNGVFAVLALLVGAAVLLRPAFGVPGRALPAWVRAVSWGAVGLGGLGLLIAVLMYFDVLAPLPTAP
ncbi:hypothetical protein [Streptomyces sp. NPDC086023]|uniref:hypothetical protein n=1 Tax=Streptomyces sp. NPDC086023 TaxID=3365746 RepID=UPI0037D67BCE